MNRQPHIILLGLFLSMNTACSSNSPGGANSGACAALAKDSQGNLKLVASTANNYTFSSTLTLDVQAVAPKSELTFDWSSLTRDMLGRDMDPKADVGMMSFFLWNLTKEQFETELNDDAVLQSDMGAVAMIYTQGALSSGTLSDLTTFGQPIDPSVMLSYLDATTYDPATHIYTVMVATGTAAGQDTRMMKAVRLDTASSNTAVTIDSTSTQLQFVANLHSLTPTNVPAGDANLAIDWSGMDGKTNAMGHTFTATNITHALVASYTQSVPELESGFLDLEGMASGMWQSDVASGTSIALSSFKDESGNSFSGIDDTHTWILALQCGSCRNPAPWYVSILTPCGN